MAQYKDHAQAIYDAVQKTSYWFHDIIVRVEANGHSEINRKISPLVATICLIFVLLVFQRICPGVLSSLADLFVYVLKELSTKVNNPAQMKGVIF